MSAGPMIEAASVWKRFRTGPPRAATLRGAFASLLHTRSHTVEETWALRDVSLAAAPGVALGLCGSNGSGKSTLLRVLAGLFPPTHGRVTVRGRVAGLFELGMGFHPEMTGRENIALTAAVMGFTAAELRGHLGPIVDFAAIGAAIDHPVKTYSAGMYMRLGFAIAAHLPAEILLIDEVLAVGDLAFQAKCLAWLDRQLSDGRALVVVSHDLAMLSKLCGEVIWMDAGAVRERGDPQSVLNLYAAHVLAPAAQ